MNDAVAWGVMLTVYIAGFALVAMWNGWLTPGSNGIDKPGLIWAAGLCLMIGAYALQVPPGVVLIALLCALCLGVILLMSRMLIRRRALLLRHQHTRLWLLSVMLVWGVLLTWHLITDENGQIALTMAAAYPCLSGIAILGWRWVRQAPAKS